MEITKTEKKFKVTIEEKTCLEEDEVIDDLCGTCRMQLREFFHPTEPVPVLLNTDKVRKEAEEDFWETHDPSGGDLPGPESEMDEEYEAQMQAAQEAKRQQAPKEKSKRQLVDYGKVWALRNAGWKARQIAEEMKISEATVWNVCKKMRAMKEMEGSKEGEI